MLYKKVGVTRIIQLSQRNDKLPFTRFQWGNYPVITIYTPPYYLDWFETYYPNVPLNRYAVPFCLQYMNGIKGGKPPELKWNKLLDTVVTILKYNKRTIDHAIYIKLLYDGTVSHMMEKCPILQFLLMIF